MCRVVDVTVGLAVLHVCCRVWLMCQRDVVCVCVFVVGVSLVVGPSLFLLFLIKI